MSRSFSLLKGRGMSCSRKGRCHTPSLGSHMQQISEPVNSAHILCSTLKTGRVWQICPGPQLGASTPDGPMLQDLVSKQAKKHDCFSNII